MRRDREVATPNLRVNFERVRDNIPETCAIIETFMKNFLVPSLKMRGCVHKQLVIAAARLRADCRLPSALSGRRGGRTLARLTAERRAKRR